MDNARALVVDAGALIACEVLELQVARVIRAASSSRYHVADAGYLGLDRVTASRARQAIARHEVRTHAPAHGVATA